MRQVNIVHQETITGIKCRETRDHGLSYTSESALDFLLFDFLDEGIREPGQYEVRIELIKVGP